MTNATIDATATSNDGVDFDTYSELYKELYGFRASRVPTQAEYDAFMASYDERFQEVNARFEEGMARAVDGANKELGTDYKTISDLDAAIEVERDHSRYDILLKWLTSY